MPKHTVVSMPGDGIGNQVLPESIRVLNAVGFDAEYIHADIGWDIWCNEGNALPDRISIYQQPIEEACEDDDEIRDCVAETVIHEFGHYFGMDEEQIEEIEEKYWRGESLDEI